MSGDRSRLLGAMWWLLMVTPAVGFAIQVSTGYMAHSPDEASGLGPDTLLVLLAPVLAVVVLLRLVLRWGVTSQRARTEAVVAALASIPLFVAFAGISELVGWPHTRTASASRFVAAAAIVIGWMAIVFLARRSLRATQPIPRS